MPLPTTGYIIADVIYTITVGPVTVTFSSSFNQYQDETNDLALHEASYAFVDSMLQSFPGAQVTMSKIYMGSKSVSIPYPRP